MFPALHKPTRTPNTVLTGCLGRPGSIKKSWLSYSVENQRNRKKMYGPQDWPKWPSGQRRARVSPKVFNGKGTGGGLEWSAVETESGSPGARRDSAKGSWNRRSQVPGAGAVPAEKLLTGARGAVEPGTGGELQERTNTWGTAEEYTNNNQTLVGYQLSGERWLGSITTKVQQ